MSYSSPSGEAGCCSRVAEYVLDSTVEPVGQLEGQFQTGVVPVGLDCGYLLGDTDTFGELRLCEFVSRPAHEVGLRDSDQLPVHPLCGKETPNTTAVTRLSTPVGDSETTSSPSPTERVPHVASNPMRGTHDAR